jgi:hypothetical protein
MSTERAVARRRPPVKSAGAAPELSRLGLAELRAHRAALSAEEDKVSYWRRLLQGRVDLLEAQAISENTLDLAALIRVLGDTGSGRSRRSLMRVPAPVQLPDLPDLEDLCQLWTTDPQDVDEVANVVERLRAKETALSEYRNALHQRIDAATGELMMRYRADPRAALMLLPPE